MTWQVELECKLIFPRSMLSQALAFVSGSKSDLEQPRGRV